MLDMPKSEEYWIRDDGPLRVCDDAPEWAKKEFEEYMILMEKMDRGEAPILTDDDRLRIANKIGDSK